MVIQISENIKQQIAERVVEMAHPGYDADYQGNWYVVDGKRVIHKASNGQWYPWSDDADIIHVIDLVWYFGGAREDHADFDAGNYDDVNQVASAVLFALGYVPDSYDQAIYNMIMIGA